MFGGIQRTYRSVLSYILVVDAIKITANVLLLSS